MAFEVMLTVQAEVDENEVIMDVAKTYPKWEDFSSDEKYADATPQFEFFCFTRDVAAGKVFFSGNKGGDVLLWGGIYNYAQGEDFVDHLGHFMAKCPEQWLSNVIVTWEREQSAVRNGRLLWTSKTIGFDAEVGRTTDERKVYSTDMLNDSYAWNICELKGPPVSRSGRILYVPWEQGCAEVLTCGYCRRLTEVFIDPETTNPSAQCVNCKRPFVLRTVWRHR